MQVGQSWNLSLLRSRLKVFTSPIVSPLDWDDIGRMQDEEESEEEQEAEEDRKWASRLVKKRLMKDHKT